MSETKEAIAGLRRLELHYFRIPRERWELILARVRQMGADAISTVVPWSWHEPRDGLFDLTGTTHPTRDVTDFLETCQAMDFRVVLHVSPYVGAGLLGGGVPGWLLAEYPEICALDPDSQPRRDPASGSPFPSAEHPTYLKYVERWYQELSDVLANWQSPAGPIVALRVDHPCLEAISTHWDYNPHVVKVQWTVWLRQQYDGIEALNAAWKTDYSSFSDAAFPRQPVAQESSPQLDAAARFVAYAAPHAAEAYARLLDEMGWTLPIAPEDNASYPKDMGPAHAVQVDPEPPQIGASVRWGMDAPLRGDGSPRRGFWTVKATLLGIEKGVKQIEGAALATSAESRRIRLPRPAGDYGVYRLLLSGELLDAPSRRRGDALFLDYPASDEAGETDMCIILDNPSAPLTGFLREYLASLLMGMAGALRRGGVMCQAVVEAFSATTLPTGDAEMPLSTEDLRAAERSLAEARRAARRAASSLGRLERLASEVRGEIAPTAPILPLLSTFSPQELERLSQIRDACAQVTPVLTEAARSITALCQTGESRGEGLTIHIYRSTFQQAQVTAKGAESTLSEALGLLRTDLAAGTLPPTAWTLQDWLTRTLQGLTAGWLE